MKVAFDYIKITPKNYLGMPMAGYELQDPCSGLLDDLHAYGILLETTKSSGGKKFLLLISLDLLKLPLSIANYIKNKLVSDYGYLKPENILIHSTHTHAAPDLTGEFYYSGSFLKGAMFGMNRNDKYILYLTHRVVKMVKNLFYKLTPCKIAWTKKPFNPDIVVNRRHPTRRTKPELGVISFRNSTNNDMIGILINYACHPTTLSFKNSKMSADYPGRIMNKIRELTNDSIKAVYFNGPAGDLNPITTYNVDYETLDQNLDPIYDQLGNYSHTTKLGNIIAQEALNIANSIDNNDYFEDMKFDSKVRDLWLPLKDYKYFKKTWFHNKLYHAIKKFLILPIMTINSANSNFKAFITKQRGIRTYCHTKIQYIELSVHSKTNSNKLSLTAVPGELFEDLGKLLVKYSPTGNENSFIFQNTNDWIAYLFSFTEYSEYGGYEPVASVGPQVGEYISRNILNLFNEIREK